MTAQSERIKREWRERERARKEKARTIVAGALDGEAGFSDAVDTVTDLLRHQGAE